MTYPTSTNPSYREVASRVLSKDGTGNNLAAYGFLHEPSAQTGPGVHVYTIITDPAGVGEKFYRFSQSSANMGMVTRYQGCTPGTGSGQDCQLNGEIPLTQSDFTWSQDSPGNLYINSTLTTLNPGTGQVQKKTDQNVDIHGNVTNVFQYDFGNLTTPARIYTYTYLNSSAYTSRYIYHRMTQATLSVGQQNVVTLATNTYDAVTFATAPSGVLYWDNSYASVTARGDVTSYTSIDEALRPRRIPASPRNRLFSTPSVSNRCGRRFETHCFALKWEESASSVSSTACIIGVAVKIEIDIPVSESALDESARERLRHDLMETAVLRLFCERRISSAEAARDLGLTRVAFMELTRQRNVPHYDYTAEDLAEDLVDMVRTGSFSRSQDFSH